VCVAGSTFVVDGVRYWDGKAGQQQAFKHYADDAGFGQPEYVSGNKLHALKAHFGIGAATDLTFDEEGNVYQEVVDDKGQSWLEELGSITDDTFGSGRK